MFSMQFEEQTWRSAQEWQRANMDADKNMSAVLTVASSLTRFLESHFRMPLSVQLHDQFLDKPSMEEALLLRCEVTTPAIRRQVSLLHRGSVMFDAESIIPLEGLPKSLMGELEAGQRPLGNLLLDQGLSLARSDLSVTQLEKTPYSKCWARRSVLRSANGTQALVIEVFHPKFWSRLQRLNGLV